MSIGKAMIIHLINGLIRRYYQMEMEIRIEMSYFSRYSHSKNEKEFELDLSDYVTKFDLKRCNRG